MALTKSWTGPQGIAVTGAYIRVQEVALVGKNEIAFRARIFKDSTIDVPFDDLGFKCAYDLNGPNPLMQAYEHIKTLPAFADAVDL